MTPLQRLAADSPSPLNGERPAAPKPGEGGAGARGEISPNASPPRQRLLLGSSFVVMLLIAAGLVAYIFFHARHNFLVTRLFTAAEVGDVPLLENLLRSGLSPDTHDVRWSSETVLMHAARNGKVEVLRSLLKHGAAIDAPYQGFDFQKGRTALMFATEHHVVANVRGSLEMLIANGANVNARDAFGQTALIFAIQARNHPASEFLLNHGADPHVQNSFGQPSLILAIENSQFDTASLLLAKGADVNAADAAMPVATLKKRTAKGMEEETVAGNSSTNAPGRTALMSAAEKGNRDLVESLLKAGANPNARDKKGVTPLKLAENYSEIVTLLKAAGAKD